MPVDVLRIIGDDIIGIVRAEAMELKYRSPFSELIEIIGRDFVF